MVRTKLVWWTSLAVAPALWACSASVQKEGTAEGSAWTCQRVNVPSGDSVECTQSVASAVYGEEEYECGGDTEYGTSDCPPPEAEPPAPDYGESDDGDDDDDEAEDGVPDDGCTCDGTGSKPGKGKGRDKGKGGSTSAGTSGGETGGDAGEPPSKGKPKYKCKVGGGKRTCTQAPSCAPGTHPAPCGACIPDDAPADCRPPTEGGCWVTGGGIVRRTDAKDTFGGNAMGMKDGSVRGQWEHVAHAGKNKVHGQARYLLCDRVPGPGPGQPSGPRKDFDLNRVRFGGPARWYSAGQWTDGFWFDVDTKDRGERGKPVEEYALTVRKLEGANRSGEIVYSMEGTMAGGNIQMHPANNGHPATEGDVPPWITP